MHELTITESLLEIALRHAEKAGASRVTDLYLVIGQLSSIVDESVQFYWDIIGEGTIAERATLHFKRIATEIECLDCHTQYSPNKEPLACPHCDSTHIKIIKGKEFFLEAINIETG